MRRVFTLIVLLIACASQILAQDLVILNGQTGNENITNTTVNINNEIYFRVKNTSSSDIANIKCYLKVSANEEAVYETDATWEFCSIQCGIDGGCPKFSLAAGAEQLVHLEFSQVNNTPCDFLVYTYPTGGNPTAIFTIHFDSFTGISNATSKSFNVYPSPANESFIIENGFGKNSYVEIYNVLGQMVKHVASDNNRISVNCSSWKNGYYVCRLYNNGKAEKTVKIVVAH